MPALMLYHGSEKIIRTPVYGAGNKNNDYGSGFYNLLRAGKPTVSTVRMIVRPF